MMSRQSTIAIPEKGLCLLNFEDGGALGISQLKILVDLMQRHRWETKDDELAKPNAIFELISGTHTGGFIAILLVVFELTAEKALEEFVLICSTILGREDLTAATRTVALQNYINYLSKKYNISTDSRLLDANGRENSCRLFVPISFSSHGTVIASIRNFEVSEEETLDLTVADAIFATLSVPLHLDPIPVNSGDPVLKSTNEYLTLGDPLHEIIKEAYRTFGSERPVACLLSIGCDHPGAVSIFDDFNMTSRDEVPERFTMDNERKASQFEEQISHLGVYHRLSASPGNEAAIENRALDIETSVNHASNYPDQATISQNIDLCLSSLKIRDGIISLGQLRNSIEEAISAARFPRVTRGFIKRKLPWEFMEKVMFLRGEGDRSTVLAITGMGGMGKTQIALRFTREHKTKFIARLYIDGSSDDRIRADIIRHVQCLEAGHSQKTFEDCMLFLERPSKNGRILLLYDNVDDPSIELSPLIPQIPSCAIIITSRNRSIGLICPEGHLELDVMSMDEAVDLLSSSRTRSIPATPRMLEDVKAVANELGRLPIALTQARIYMYETRCTAQEYLERLSSSRAKVLAAPIKHQRNIRYISAFAAFEASYERLNPSLQQLLCLLSCFHWGKFPLELVTFSAKRKFIGYEREYVEHGEEFYLGKKLLEDIFLVDGRWSTIEMDRMLTLLQNHSLSTLSGGIETKVLQMHPLLHEWIYSQIPNDQLPQYQSAAVILLSLGARDDHTSSTQYLADHAVHLSSLWGGLRPNEAEAFAHILQEAGQSEGSRRLRERVVENLMEENILEIGTICGAKSLLASTYRELAMLSAAEKLQQEVLNQLRKARGSDHPDTITACGDLALTYRDLGYLQKAETLQEEVLQRRKDMKGEVDQETVDALNDLAITYRDRGRLEEAKSLQMEVLGKRKETLGERHRDTINASATLAVILHDLKRYAEAEAIQVEVLKTRRQILGSRHPLTIDASTNLGITYGSLGRLEEAELLQEHALALRKELFGDRHPGTLMASNNLANVYYQGGKFEKAEKIQENVVKLGKETWGNKHPNTAIAMLTLAEIYESLGKTMEASTMIDLAINILRNTVGQSHPLFNFGRSLGIRVQNDMVHSTGPSNAFYPPYTDVNEHCFRANVLHGLLNRFRRLLGVL